MPARRRSLPHPDPSRRRFLQQLAAGTGAVALGGCGGFRPDVPCLESLALGTESEEADVVVVGSGFGGAIAAARLTALGIPVLLLERGRRWDVTGQADHPFCSVKSPDERSTWLSKSTDLPTGLNYGIKKYVGVLERRRFDGIDVYAGAGYGGGSLVYGGILLEPRREVFEPLLPAEIDYDELQATYFPRVRERIGATPMPDDVLAAEHFTYARVFRDQATKAGLEVVPIPSGFDWDVVCGELAGTIPAATIEGETITGINSGAKRSLDRNYLRDAEGTGRLTVRLLTEVQEISQLADGRYLLDCNHINESGCVIGRREIVGNRVFLAAGSVNTTTLLVKGREKGLLPAVSEHAGTNWGNNGNVHFARSFVGESTGRMQGMPVVFGCRSSSDMPVATAENAPLPLGLDCRCLLHLATAHTEARGHFSYDATSDVVDLHYPAAGRAEAGEAARAIVDRLNEANGGRLGNFLFPGLVDGFTYHPVGGATLGSTCDHAGRVLGQPGLYVVDGALMPGTGGAVNPALAIAALAERCLDVVIEEDLA